jgi:hypothetical protein
MTLKPLSQTDIEVALTGWWLEKRNAADGAQTGDLPVTGKKLMLDCLGAPSTPIWGLAWLPCC